MIFMKPKYTVFVFVLAATALPVAAAFAQPNNELLPPPVVAGSAAQSTTPPTVQYLSEDQLDAAFEKALQTFGQDAGAAATTPPGVTPAPTTAETPTTTPVETTPTAQTQNPDYPKPAPIAALPATAVNTESLPIGQVRLNVNMENMPLEKVMATAVKIVSDKTGKWDVRWRLKKENQRLLDERVNINAETNFENFMAYLMERINNMTGVQLFVKVFEGSRLIIIADTY